MRYEGRVAWGLVMGRGDGLLSMMRLRIDYGEWLVGETVSGECGGGWAAFGPRTSGNQRTPPVTSGQQISRS
jgi:hypothetical protein